MYIDGTAPFANGPLNYTDPDSTAYSSIANTSGSLTRSTEQNQAASFATGDLVTLSPAALALAAQASILSSQSVEDADATLREYLKSLQEDSEEGQLGIVESILRGIKANRAAALESAARSVEASKEQNKESMNLFQEGEQETAGSARLNEQGTYQTGNIAFFGQETNFGLAHAGGTMLTTEPFLFSRDDFARAYSKTGAAGLSSVGSEKAYRGSI